MAFAEETRRSAGLSQAALAKILEASQGHYSKLAAGKVPLGRKARTKIEAWLASHETTAPDPNARRAELMRLAAEITMQCMRLTDLAGRS